MHPSEFQTFVRYDPERIDKKSGELNVEFFKHVAEVQKEHPDCPNQEGIFSGWAIQKIASLQLLTLDLIKEVDQLRCEAMKKRR
jgi:hypothetical protein